MKHVRAHEGEFHLLPKSGLISYVLGFLFSVLLTLWAFWAAPAFGAFAPLAILVAAILQLFVQLVFFLHLGRGRNERWNLGIFVFTVIIIAVVIGGTLWIMRNLAHLHPHDLTPAELYENGIVAPQNELR